MGEYLSDRGQPLTKVEHVEQDAVGDAVMVALLHHHGCSVVTNTVAFPKGTVAQEILPRYPWTARYKVFLPDGVELLWKQRRSMGGPAPSMLQVSTELYEQEAMAAQAACSNLREEGEY
ncbi:MAG: hypothetical protein JO125_13160 [Chloroflexi bacterium]|nr:hypothetical protein [Chloroflexota bacterium]